jgi:hypothetical protein
MLRATTLFAFAPRNTEEQGGTSLKARKTGNAICTNEREHSLRFAYMLAKTQMEIQLGRVVSPEDVLPGYVDIKSEDKQGFCVPCSQRKWLSPACSLHRTA